MERSRLELGEPIGDAVSRVRFAPSSNHLLVSSWDSSLRLYDVDGSVQRLHAVAEGALLDCCFEGEAMALSAGSDGCIRRYDLCSETDGIVGRHDDSITCIEYSEATGQVITASLDKKLKFWDMHMRSGKPTSTKTVELDVGSFSLCGAYLLVATGRKVDMYDLRYLTGPVQEDKSCMEYNITCISSFTRWQGYASGSVDECVQLKYFDQAKEIEMGCIFRCHPKSKSRMPQLVAINDIGFHPCHETLVTGDNKGYAIIWDAKQRKKLFELPRYPNSVASLSFNYSGELLAVASSFTYQEANEVEEAPEIYIQRMEDLACPSLPGKGECS